MFKLTIGFIDFHILIISLQKNNSEN
jgi:hypothetical protein